MAIALYWKPTPWAPVCLTALPALLIYAVTSVWLAAILAPLCARYRDLFHAVQTSMRLIFFATPILWMPSSSGRLMLLAKLNPISHFVAIVRDPLMYDRFPADSWLRGAGDQRAGPGRRHRRVRHDPPPHRALGLTCI